MLKKLICIIGIIAIVAGTALAEPVAKSLCLPRLVWRIYRSG